MINSAVDYEQLSLGLLINHPVLKDEMDMVANDYTTPANKLILQTINEMLDAGKDVDLFLLAQYLEGQQNLTKVGGIGYLTDIVSSAPAKENAKSYAKIVKQQAQSLDLLQRGALIQSILAAPGDPSEKLAEVESIIHEINLDDRQDCLSSISDYLPIATDLIGHRFDNQDQDPECAYGYSMLDEMTCGAQPGDLIVIAARPSMGKTALAMNIAENFGFQGKVGLIASIEMGTGQLVMRMISSIGRIDAQKLRTGKLDEDDFDRITMACMKINTQLKIYIDETAGTSPSRIRRAANRVKKQSGALNFIVIDYLQLMNGDKTRYDNRTAEIGDISRSLKLLAKEFNVPIVLLSQLNRNLDQRQNKRPVMSDLRESGAIEQDADVIMFIYRDEVYNPDSPEKGNAELIIAKQRNGPTGMVPLAFKKEISKFEELHYGRGGL